MRIWYNIPYLTEKDLGKAYNSFMELLPDNDWACFIDRDAMFLNPFYGTQIENIIKQNGDAVYTAKANRIGCKWQREDNMWEEDRMSYHVLKSIHIERERGLKVKDVTDIQGDALGGFLIVISKKLWKEIRGFKEGMGMLGIDNQLHYSCRANGKKVFLMEGVYLYHWYRGGKASNKDHLK